MNEIIALPEFGKNLKWLNKKYQSLKLEIKEFIEKTEFNGAPGTAFVMGCLKPALR